MGVRRYGAVAESTQGLFCVVNIPLFDIIQVILYIIFPGMHQ